MFKSDSDFEPTRPRNEQEQLLFDLALAPVQVLSAELGPGDDTALDLPSAACAWTACACLFMNYPELMYQYTTEILIRAIYPPPQTVLELLSTLIEKILQEPLVKEAKSS